MCMEMPRRQLEMPARPRGEFEPGIYISKSFP